MRFYRAKIILLASVLLVSLTDSPAYAIFGLSKCEKLKSFVSSEQKINNLLTDNFNKTLDLEKSRYSDHSALKSAWLAVFTSRQKLIEKVNQNPTCVSKSAIADARTALETYKDIISRIKKWDGNVLDLSTTNKLEKFDYFFYYFKK